MMVRVNLATAMVAATAAMGLMALTAGGTVDPDAPAVSPTLVVSDDGIAVNWAGKALITETTPTAEKVTLEARSVNPENNRWEYDYSEASLEGGNAQLDREKQRIARPYDWGEVRVAYRLEGDHLTLAVELENRTKRAIADFRVRLLTLNLPNQPEALEVERRRKQRGLHSSTLDQPVAYAVDAPQGKLFASYDSFAPPIHFGIDGDTEERPGRYPLYIAGGVKAVPRGAMVAPQMGVPYLPPGETLKLRISIRFADRAARRGEVLRPFYRSYRRFHEPMLDWPDRRPIGAAFLMQEFGKQPPKFGQEGINPRRWFSGPLKTVEMDSPHGRSMLRRYVRDLSYNTVRSLTRLDAQGMILWNVEGGFHSTGWVGDPRMLPILSPELDRAMDEYFQIIRDAGFTPGVTLRAGQLRWNPGRQNWSQGAGNHNPLVNPLLDDFDKYVEAHPHEPWWRVYPVAERLSKKITYARKRWGCRIFYIDTNIVHRGWGPDQRFNGKLIEAHIWRKVREDHPDVLIIPEITGRKVGYLAHVAPYGQMGYGRVRSRYGADWTRDMLPDYFGTHYVSDGNVTGTRTQRVQELARGLIFFNQGWGWSSNNEAVVEYMNQARANQKRLTTLARRYGLVDRPDAALPYPFVLERARSIHPDTIVTDPPASSQLRVFTNHSAGKRDAILICTWLGNPHAPGATLKGELPGVELDGKHRWVWDVASGDLISSSDGVAVASDPVTGMRALYVQARDEAPPAPRPDGVRLAVSFDEGLAPEMGGGMLGDNGDAARVASPHGRAIRITPGGGSASYSPVPSWYAGTLEFNLRARQADARPLELVRFQHHMDTTLSLVVRDGKPMLQLQTFERPSHKRYWKDQGLLPAPDVWAEPVMHEALAPLPADGDWHRVALVWDAGNYLLYLDGEQRAMIAEPFVMRWRDGEIFKPGLVLGGGKRTEGAGEAHLDSLVLYGWNFDAAQAAGRNAVAAIEPLVRPADAAPSVWIWGTKPKEVRRLSVNMRRSTNGDRTWQVKAELFEKTEGGLRKLASAGGLPCHGRSVLIVEYEEEAPPPEAGDIADAMDDEQDLIGVKEFLKTTRKYVLKITPHAAGQNPPTREIEFEFGTEGKRVHHW